MHAGIASKFGMERGCQNITLAHGHRPGYESVRLRHFGQHAHLRSHMGYQRRTDEHGGQRMLLTVLQLPDAQAAFKAVGLTPEGVTPRRRIQQPETRLIQRLSIRAFNIPAQQDQPGAGARTRASRLQSAPAARPSAPVPAEVCP